MLTLTETATNVVKAIVAQGPSTETGGLRINAADTASPELAVAVAEKPEASDAIIDTEGARVYLDENASVVLADKVLDAQVDEDGSVRFAIGQQA